MTTAHKPTWQPARGTETGGANLSVPTRSYSSRDLPGHLTLKVRQDGQDSRNDLRYKDFKAELIEKEKKLLKEKNEKKGIFTVEDDKKDPITYKEPEQRKKLKTNQQDVIKQLNQYGSDDEEDIKNKPIGGIGEKDEESESSSSEEIDEEVIKKKAAESINPFPQDADDLDFANTSSSDSENEKKNKDDSSESSSSESDDDDDEELLMREYQKIKEQREAEEKEKDVIAMIFKLQQQQLKKQDELEKLRQQNLLTHNPLLDQSSYNLKKKWFEDSVFKNQAKRDKEEKQRFINDNVRSDFHRKFLKKFIYT